MTNMAPQEEKDASHWSGIPQKKLRPENRLHIALLCQALRTGPWNIAANWEKASYHPGSTILSLERPQLASFDDDALTRLVIPAHDHCQRIAIMPHTFRALKIGFWVRQREGDIAQRHPRIEDAITNLRTP